MRPINEPISVTHYSPVPLRSLILAAGISAGLWYLGYLTYSAVTWVVRVDREVARMVGGE